LDLKKLLASSHRQKILKALSECREMRVMQLVHRVGGPYNEVNRNLKILETEGIIINDYRKQVKRAKVRVIILNRENPRAQILLKVLKELETENSAIGTLSVI
jgi:predicted transcriptional regulator